jgi:hypothetical protein
MANILRFTKGKTIGQARIAKGPAAIIIFPGVRYERLDDAKVALPRRRRSQRKA